MILSFHPCFMADTQVVLGDGPLDRHDITHIRAADAIILPQTCTLELYQACINSSARLFPRYDARFDFPGKIGQSQLFGSMNLPHPKTRPWASVSQFKKVYHEKGVLPHRMPFLIKADGTHEAENIYLITGVECLDSALDNLMILERSEKSGFVTQDMIHAEGHVLRAVVIGQSIITYWKRPEKAGQLITTISQGGKVDKDWRPDLQKKGRELTRMLCDKTGINLAAIDFICSLAEPDPVPLFLEINYYFGRHGLGGSEEYYRLLFAAIQTFMSENGLDPEGVKLL